MRQKIRKPSWWTNRDTLVALVFFAIAGFVGFGFLKPDPYLQNNEVDHGPLLYLIRYGTYAAVPLMFYGFAASYVMVRSGRLPARVLKTGLIALVLLGLVVYVPVSYVYELTLAPRDGFHPYLQLFPRDVPAEVRQRGVESNLVVCLGGSTTDFEDTHGKDWPSRVQRHLAKAFPEREIRVLNQGRAWYTTQHSLINYEANIRPLKPDVIVVMHAINDLMQNADHGKYANGSIRSDYGHHYGPVARLARTRPLFHVVGETIRSMWYWTPREVLEVDSFPGIAIYQRNLERLVQLARLDGTKVVIMTQPYLYHDQLTPEEKAAIWMHTHNGVGRHQRWSIATAQRGMEQYNEVIRELALRHNVPVVELERRVPKTLEYLIDDCHYALPAYELIGREVASCLTDVLPSRSVRSEGLLRNADSDGLAR